MVTVAAVGVALVAGAAGCSSGPHRARSAAVGQPAPPFRLPNVRESEPDVSLADVAGKPLVINFWASWCVPCRKEMPAFEAVHRRRGDRVSFIGIDRQDDRSDALRFLARTRVSYPLGYDPDGRLDAAYRLRGMPTTVVVGADGLVVDHVSGPMSEDRLDQVLDRAASAGRKRS
jgi:cytochrome c biogenesis protein CcmG, thiol:disulfide interchange protein DsbE